jgi:hypothetical protein
MVGKVSQRSIGAMSRVLPFFFDGRSDVRETLCENGFPDWFIRRSQQYAGQWLEILFELRRGTFFFPPNNIYTDDEGGPIEGVTSEPHWDGDPVSFGEFYIQKLAGGWPGLSKLSNRAGAPSLSLRSWQGQGGDFDLRRG